MMTQTLALFVDAYRELNSQKLFWVTLGLSGLIALLFAAVGIDERGITFFHWHVIGEVTSAQLTPETLYKTMFVSLGIGFWLAWVATILGLIATAGIFPTFIGGGAIELVLSKPIGRVRLFLTKYATGLLFVTLQVAVFTGACFLIIGLRGGVWEPGLFLAVPIVVCFFSYLFSFCVLVGLVTRSTIAALLITLLFWLVLFVCNVSDALIVRMRLTAEQRVAMVERALARRPAGSKNTSLDQTLTASRESLATWRKAEWASRTVRTFMPKTSDTIALLQRSLIDLAELPEPAEDGATDAEVDERGAMSRFKPDEVELARRAEEEARSRSLAWVLGTSLAFEAVVLAMAAWTFYRRDFS